LVIHATCFSGFNTLRAFEHIGQAGIERLNIKAVVLDSIFLSIKEISGPTVCTNVKKVVPELPGLYWVSKHIALFLHTLVYRPFASHITVNTSKIPHVPLGVIHSLDDTLVPYAHMEHFIKTHPGITSWLIEKPSVHAAHYLKHSQEYHQWLNNFIDTHVQ
jgi:hypothetical protein